MFFLIDVEHVAVAGRAPGIEQAGQQARRPATPPARTISNGPREPRRDRTEPVSRIACKATV